MKFSALVVTTAAIIAITNVRIAAGVFYCKSLTTKDTCDKDQRCEWYECKFIAILLFPAFIVSDPLLL